MDKKIFKLSGGKKRLELNQENARAIDLVCAYANKEAKFEKHGYDLNKGLLLAGKTGSGKTLLMQTYHAWVKHQLNRSISFHKCRDINHKFLEIDPMTQKLYGYYGIKGFCSITFKCEKIFDDIGSEETFVNNYGNKVCLMDYVLNQRWEHQRS